MSRGRCSPVLRAGALLAVLGTLASSPAAAAGRHVSRRGSAKARVAELLDTAQTQSGAGELQAARTTLEQAYRLQPSPEILCALGTLAAKAGRLLDAQDALRRCAASGAAGRDAEPNPAASRRPDSGELTVLGPRRALVLVDAHVMGVLPLSAALLLAPGPHQISLEVGTRRVSSPVNVPAGRAALLTLASQPRLMLMPAAALLVDFAGIPEATESLFYQTASQAIKARNLGLLGQWGALTERLELGGCRDAVCQQALAQKYALRYVVAARAVAEPDGWQLFAQLFDAEIGAVASEQSGGCEHCTGEQASARLGELLGQALLQGQSRPTGILEVTSIPPGGEVLLAGLRLGQTPLRHPAFAGEHAIVVQHPGFAPYQNEVVVEPGRGAALDAVLRTSTVESALTAPDSAAVPARAQAELAAVPATRQKAAPAALPSLPAPPPLRRAPRPRWRLGLGIAASIVGAALSGFGAAGLALDGSCTQTPLPTAAGELCPSGRVVDSSAAGAGLLAAGLSTLGAGTLLWALPGARTIEIGALANLPLGLSATLPANPAANRSAATGVAVRGDF